MQNDPFISHDESIIDVSGNTDVPIHYGTAVPENNLISDEPSSNPESWKTGRKYSRKLNLTAEQAAVMDKLWFTANVFNDIEYCKIQILKQFLRAFEFLQNNCIPVNRAYASVIEELSEIIVCLQYNYRKESLNYQYTYDSVQGEILNHILKLCENNVREAYGIKRKINTDFPYANPDIRHQYNRKIVSKLEIFLSENQHQVLDADYKTNIILNENNTSRWKTKFEEIKGDYSNPAAFEREVFRLADVNVKNPSVDMIFFEASKFVARYDKNCALRLYIHYLDKDLNSPKLDRKQLSKSIQKSLFSTTEQIHDFERILSTFIRDRNLKEAIEKVNQLYLPKRKKIIIDPDAVEDVKRQHSGTVALLEEYLSDEPESGKAEAPAGDEELTINIAQTDTEPQVMKYREELNLTDIHQEILTLFEKQSFNILQSEMSTFLRSKNLFMGAVIDSINDLCYETLDDILIEEEDDYFTMNTDYYKKILNHD